MGQIRIIKSLFASLIFLLGLNTQLLSQAQVSAIDTIVIQTTNIPLKSNETGRNVTVIPQVEIAKMSYTSLDDLLQYLPGIEVQSRNAFGAQGDISMRGATYTQVLVLINGMKINDPLTGHFNSYMPVTPAEIERIEVLRGAASAIYGADAVGGVINIITKSFRSEDNLRTDISGELNYGENKLVNTQQGMSVGNNKYYIGGGIYMNKSDGELVPENSLTDSTSLAAYNNFFDIRTVGISAGYKFNNQWNIQLRSAYDDRDFAARYFYTNSTFDKSVEATRNWWNQIKINNINENNSTDINLAFRAGTDEFVFSPDFPSTNLHNTQFWNLNVNHLRILSDRLSIKVGGQFDRRSIESTDRGNHNNIHFGGYAMGVFRAENGLNVTGSLRLDYDDNYKLEFTPQVNLSYNIDKLTLRASAGRSIRAADYTERFVSYNIESLSPGRSLGNPNLAAESSWSEEIGIDVQLARNWTIKATGFSRQSSNLIDYVPTLAEDIERNSNLNAGVSYFYANNITDVTTSGFELESWLSKKLGDRKTLSWSLGYTFLNTTNEEDVISVYISSHAKHLVTTNFILNLDKFDLSINGIYKQRTERFAEAINSTLAPSYTLWNARVGFRVTNNFGIQFQIHNLMNTEYQDFLGARMPGRWMMGGLKYKF